MKSLKIILLSLVLSWSPPVAVGFAKDSHSEFYHSRVKKRCDLRQADKAWARGFSAFARDSIGMHCGRVRRDGSLNRAKKRAIEFCESIADRKCNVIWSKSP